MSPTTWRSETSTQPRLRSTRLRSGREPRPGPGRRTRPRGKRGWALFQPLFLSGSQEKLTCSYSFAAVPRGWGVLGVRRAAAEAPGCQQALRAAGQRLQLSPDATAQVPGTAPPLQCSGSYLRDTGLTETDKAIHQRLSSSRQGLARVTMPRLRSCSCCLWSRERLALGHRHCITTVKATAVGAVGE